MVLDPSSSPVSRMHGKIPGGYLHFQKGLATHMIHHCLTTNASRVDGKVHTNLPSINCRLRFVWAREQRAQYTKDFYEGIKMPTITNLGDYGKLPVSLKAGLFTVLEQASQIVRRKYPGAMSDSLRTKLFAFKLNGRLGNPILVTDLSTLTLCCSTTPFCPVSLTRKNDHRTGYDHCAVYTFSTNISGRVCRVAVIMTSRTAAGAWLENRFGPEQTNKQKIMQNQIIQTTTFIARHISSLIIVLSNISCSLVSFRILFTIQTSYSSYYCMSSCFFCHSVPLHSSRCKPPQTVLQKHHWAKHMAATDNVLWSLFL